MVLLLGRYALLVLSGLATLFYLLATLRGVKEWHCWAKPPWVTLFWGGVFAAQGAILELGPQRVSLWLHHVWALR